MGKQPSSTAAVAEHPLQQKQRQAKQQQGSKPLTPPLTGRKNPELYSLASQQQDLAAPQLSSISGSVGSTGSFGPTAAVASSHSSDHRTSASTQRQQLYHQEPRLTNRPSTKPEVLAPAGGWPQLRAAVENGADAVYFGVTGFNARAR